MSKKVKQKKYNKQRAESRIQTYADQIGSSVKVAAEDPRGYTAVLTDEEIRHLNESQSETNEEITMMDSIKNAANEKVAQTKTFAKSTADKVKDSAKFVGVSFAKTYKSVMAFRKVNKDVRNGGYAVAAAMVLFSIAVNPASWAAAPLAALLLSALYIVAMVEISTYAAGMLFATEAKTVSVH